MSFGRILFALLALVTIGGSLTAQSDWRLVGSPDGHAVSSLAIQPDGKILAGTRGGLFESATRGAVWTTSGLSSEHGPILSVFVTSSGDVLAGTVGAFFTGTTWRKPANTSNWQEVTALRDTWVYDFEEDAQGNLSAAAHGLVRMIPCPTGGESCTNGGVFISDNGIDWMRSRPSTAEVNTLVSLPNGRLVAGSDALYVSDDNGGSWSASSNYSGSVLSSTKGSSGALFVGTDGGGLLRVGPSENQAEVAVLENEVVSDLAIGAAGEIVAVVPQDGAMVSLDDGATWSTLGGMRLEETITAIAVDGDGFYYAGTDAGNVYVRSAALPIVLSAFDVTVDNGTLILKWSTESEQDVAGFSLTAKSRDETESDLGYASAKGGDGIDAEYRLTSDRLVPDTYDVSLWEIGLDGSKILVKTIEVNVVGGRFDVSPAFPNPTSGSTRVSVTLTQDDSITLTVYDLAGRRMSSLAPRMTAANSTTALDVDATDLAPGQYLVSIEGSSLRDSQMITVVR